MISAAVKDWVRQYTARHIKWAVLAVSSIDGYEEIEGEEQGSENAYQLPARRFQHYGYRSRPPVGSEMICVAPAGGESQRVSIASEKSGQGPDSQEEGEVEVYSKFGQRVTLDKDGAITITGKATVKIDQNGKVTIDAAAGQDVQVNGGTLRVARETDPVDPSGGMTAWMSQVVLAITNLIAGAPAAPPMPPAPPSFAFIRTGAGAPNFKG